MPSNNHEHRTQFHDWLVANGLDTDVAGAILATMSPFDWDELATKADLAALEASIESRFDARLNAGLDQVRAEGERGFAQAKDERERGFAQAAAERRSMRAETHREFGEAAADRNRLTNDLRTEMQLGFAELRTDLRIVLLAVMGFMLTVMVTGAVIAFGP